jgi:hypothetical protein
MFRFTIRDVLWLTVVVGLGVALTMSRSQGRTMRSEIEFQSERLFWADANILTLAEGWQKDMPNRIEIEGDWIAINHENGTQQFERPLRPK